MSSGHFRLHSDGTEYHQQPLEPRFGPDHCGSSCVQPLQSELESLVASLRTSGCRVVVSIGCGEGLLEGLLQRPPLSMKTIAVDVDFLKLHGQQQQQQQQQQHGNEEKRESGDGYSSMPRYTLDQIIRLPST